MWNKIVFFELRHYGDLHITRNFVRYVIKNIPAEQYTYVLKGTNPKVLSDLGKLCFATYDPLKHPFCLYDPWKIEDGVLYINTSCGAGDKVFFQGTSIQTAFCIFSCYLARLCKHHLPIDPLQFIPYIDFSFFKVQRVDSFMSSIERRKRVLFINGDTQSGQSANINWSLVLLSVAKSHPRIDFFISNEECFTEKKTPSNVYLCSDIIGIRGENDITETAYFGHYCDLIIGRSSGVYTLCINQDNVFNNPKKFLCFSHWQRDRDLGVTNFLPGSERNFTWSNDYSLEGTINAINKQLQQM